jgi:hypothetical protein
LLYCTRKLKAQLDGKRKRDASRDVSVNERATVMKYVMDTHFEDRGSHLRGRIRVFLPVIHIYRQHEKEGKKPRQSPSTSTARSATAE